MDIKFYFFFIFALISFSKQQGKVRKITLINFFIYLFLFFQMKSLKCFHTFLVLNYFLKLLYRHGINNLIKILLYLK